MSYTGILYSFSEKEVKGFPSRSFIENIGCTTLDLEGRLAEKMTSACPVDMVCNYKVQVTKSSVPVRTLEKEVHNRLKERKISLDCGSRKEWFYKGDPPSWQIIADTLDTLDVNYTIEHNPIVKAKRRLAKLPNETKFDKEEKIELRPFQRESIEFMKMNTVATIVAPGGSGKTLIYALFIQSFGWGIWLVLVPYTILVGQVMTTLKRLGLPCYSYQMRLPEPLPEFFIMVSTYQSCKAFEHIVFDGIIADEGHRTVLTITNEESDFQKAVKNFQRKRTYFFTSTPKIHQGTKKSDGISMDNEDIFGQKLTCSYERALKEGYIVDYVVRVLKPKRKNKQILKIIEETEPRKGIIFCNTIEEVEQLYEDLEQTVETYTVLKLHSRLSKNKQKTVKRKFEKSTRSVLITCDMASVGYDVPPVNCIIHYSGVPDSTVKNSQQNSRGQRCYKDKYCYRVYYFINDLKEVKKIIKLLSKNDYRFTQRMPAVIEKGVLGGGRFGYCAERELRKVPKTDITRALVSIVTGETSDVFKLKRLLMDKNKDEMVLIDRRKVIKQYQGIIDDIERICYEQKNFPLFALPSNIYLRYISQLVIESEEIRKICLKNGINNSSQYRKKYDKYKLPCYSFILNGGIKGIENLETFLSGEIVDEN